MYYGDKQDSLVSIMSGLAYRGWSIYGFKEDRSNSMEDYFDPARWDGIAVKNGFILVIDNYSGGTIGGDFVRTSYDPKIAKRIQKLQTLADNHAASQGERDNALAMIAKFDDKLVQEIIVKGDKPPVTYQKNPGNSKWHIEKDGQIIAKGTGVFGFRKINTCREEFISFENYHDNHDSWGHRPSYWSEEEWPKHYENVKKEEKETTLHLDKYFKLLDKFDSLVIIKIGEGEEEKLVKKIVTKKVTYLVAEESATPTQYVRLGKGWTRAAGLEQYNTYKICEGGKSVRKLTKDWVTLKDGTNIHSFKSEPRKNTKPNWFNNRLEAYEKGHFVYIKLVELHDSYDEEVWVKKTASKPSKKKSKTPQKPKQIKLDTKSDTQVSDVNVEYEDLIAGGEISDFERTDNQEIEKVLKITEKIDDFKSFNKYMISQKIGYYSRIARGFILKNDYLIKITAKNAA